MPSSSTTERARGLDASLFHLAFGGAITVAVVTAAGAVGRADLALTGAALTTAGAALSWWMRAWPLRRALSLGLTCGGLAGVFWLFRIGIDPASFLNGEFGQALVFLMTVPLVVLSYVLVRPELASFALVPGLSALSLAASQGDESVARVGFIFYLPLALLAVGYAMLFSGGGARGLHRLPQGFPVGPRGLPWSVRHWPTLLGVIAVIMLTAEALYLPLQAWATAHRWQFISAISSPGLFVNDRSRQGGNAPSTYAVGRGPIPRDGTPVLAITGDYAAYWRGEVFDTYQGATWGQSGLAAPRQAAPSRDSDGSYVLAPVPPKRPTASYQVTAQTDLPLVFEAPGEVYRVRPSEPLSLTSRVTVNGYGVVRAPNVQFYAGLAYDVTAGSFETATGRLPVTEVPDDRYLALPLETSRVAEVARQVAGSEPTPQKKMAALIGYLQTHCTYSLEAPAIPPGNDAVEFFLFRQKVGYCDLFASALAVMGRAVGVPTRFVTGYAFPTAAPDAPGGGRFLLTRDNTHAWVEAFLPDSGGWTTLDATPAAGDTAALSAHGWPLRFVLLWRLQPWLAGTLGLGVLLAVGGLLWTARFRLRRRRTEALPGAASGWRADMTRLYLRLDHLLRRRGYPRSPTQTPLEYLASLEQRWAAQEGWAATLPLVRSFTEAFVTARYGPGPVPEEMAQAARDTLAQIQRTLPARRR